MSASTLRPSSATLGARLGLAVAAVALMATSATGIAHVNARPGSVSALAPCNPVLLKWHIRCLDYPG